MSGKKATISQKELELLKDIGFMAVQWARSLIDCNVKTGKRDLKIAQRAYKMITKKMNFYKNSQQ